MSKKHTAIYILPQFSSAPSFSSNMVCLVSVLIFNIFVSLLQKDYVVLEIRLLLTSVTVVPFVRVKNKETEKHISNFDISVFFQGSRDFIKF